MSDPAPPGDGGAARGLYGQVSISGQRLSLARPSAVPNRLAAGGRIGEGLVVELPDRGGGRR